MLAEGRAVCCSEEGRKHLASCPEGHKRHTLDAAFTGSVCQRDSGGPVGCPLLELRTVPTHAYAHYPCRLVFLVDLPRWHLLLTSGPGNPPRLRSNLLVFSIDESPKFSSWPLALLECLGT